jgi:hypothetical protein
MLELLDAEIALHPLETIKTGPLASTLAHVALVNEKR